MRPACAVLLVALFAACGTASQPSSPETSGPPEPSPAAFVGKLVNFRAVDTKHLQVFLTIHNTGGVAAKADCDVEAFNPFGDFAFDIFGTRKPLGPGETIQLRGFLTVSNEGARAVRRVTVRNCREA